MELKKKNHYLCWILVISCLNNSSAEKMNYIEIKKLQNLANNYLVFESFYKMYTNELYLDNRQECDKCMTIGTHYYVNNLQHTVRDDQTCRGNIDSCILDHKSETIINNEILINNKIPYINNIESSQAVSQCGSCVCYCYDNLLNGRDKNMMSSICLDPISADVSKGRVVIGVQFVKVDNTLMIRIKTGKLQSQRTIVRGSGEWSSQSTSSSPCKKPSLLNHRDSYLLMDDVMLPDDYVVTGIAMHKCQEKWVSNNSSINSINNCKENFYYLTVYGSQINSIMKGIDDEIIEGTLKGPKSIQERVELTNDDMLPSELASRNTLRSTGNFFIKFRTTSWVQDKGKHIIPYLNSQPLEARPSKPLRGVGLVYSGDKPYGGFVSPVLYARRN